MWTIACQTPLSMGFFWQEYGVETYLTACEIDSLWGFAVWLRELKLGLCNSLEGWDGEGGGREETYVYLWLIHADIWQKPKEFCKAFILQLKNKKKRMPECVDTLFSRRSSPPRDWTWSSPPRRPRSLLHCKRILYHLATMEASLIAQMVKTLPTVQETQVQSLGEKIPWSR